jgi:hypothetical protein
MWTASAPGGHSAVETALLVGNSTNAEWATGQCTSTVHVQLYINKTTTFLSEHVQTRASLRKPKKSASHKLNQLGQIFDKFML